MIDDEEIITFMKKIFTKAKNILPEKQKYYSYEQANIRIKTMDGDLVLPRGSIVRPIRGYKVK